LKEEAAVDSQTQSTAKPSTGAIGASRKKQRDLNAELDEALMATFPASDPVALESVAQRRTYETPSD
jgi:hypothetical protein